MTATKIRLATQADLEAINEIYNYYVAHSTCTYQETPEPIERRRAWAARQGEKYPVSVAETDRRVVGWGSLSPYHERSGYRFTVENSVYIHHEFQRRGVGSLVLADLMERAKALGYHTIIAGIDGDQPASVALHSKFGFQPAGRLYRAGFKFGRWLDVIYMQAQL